MAKLSAAARLSAGVLAAGLVLAGCSTHPGAAAVVDGHRISEASLAESGDTLQLFLSDQLTPSQMLSSMIEAPIYLKAASKYGIAASNEDAEKFLDSTADSAGLDAPEEYPEGTLEVTRMIMISKQVQSSPDGKQIVDMATAQLGQLDVSVNPRYGEWDPEAQKGSFIDSTTPDWIIAPAPAADSGAGSTQP